MCYVWIHTDHPQRNSSTRGINLDGNFCKVNCCVQLIRVIYTFIALLTNAYKHRQSFFNPDRSNEMMDPDRAVQRLEWSTSAAVCWVLTGWLFVSLELLNSRLKLNPLNAQLNSICHLLVLIGDLTFMGPCIVSIFQYTCISNKIQRYTVYFYLETALHVSGGTSTHHQERMQLYLQHLVFVTPLLLSAAIVEELEPVGVFCGWRTPPAAHSNRLYDMIWYIC
jgi:hypothetical protein